MCSARARGERGAWSPADVLRRAPADVVRTIVPLLAVIVGLSLYTNTQNSTFLTGGNVQNILVQSSSLGILAVGQTFLLVGGQLDLSVGSMVSFTGVVGAWQYARGWSEWVILVVLLAIGSGVGLVWGLVVSYLRVPPFILTLGGLSVLSSLALVISHNAPISVVNAFNGLGFGSWLGLAAPAALFLGLAVAGALLLHYTRFGRQVYALGSSEQAAFLAGLPVRRIKVQIFVLNGLLAAVAGLVQLARLAAGDPNGGTGLELSCIAAIVLGGASLAGGRGTMLGSLVGVLVFGVIDASLTFLNVAASWQSLVSGAVLIFAVTTTSVAELRRERRAGRQARLGDVLAGLVLRRPPAVPLAVGSQPSCSTATREEL